MRIAVLGPLEVWTDDLAPVPVPGAKERLLLAALAARAPGVVSTDSLVETLWDGDPPASARKSLQAHVVRLRSSLEPDRPRGSTGQYVVRRGPGYALTLGRGDIDALRIGDLASRGRAHLAAGDPKEAERLLASAVGLWRGEPYSDWPDAAFAETERRRLAEIRSGALAGLLEARIELGRHADVLPELEALVAQDPLREEWWRLLMLALYRAGRQAEALATGRRVRALLAEELGTEPGPGLREAEAAILAQDPALERARPASVAAGPAQAGACPYKGLFAYQVADAPLFHGRRRLVAALVARLVDAAVVVVSGPSGAGKSSVVRAGLVPSLARGSLPGSEAWRPVIVTPGLRPVDVLAALTGESPPTDPVLLVCDQFEELWAPGVDPGERAAFLDAVLGLLDDGVVVRCVVVLRGDHVGRLAEHAAFTEALGGAMVLVPVLTDEELGEIVREPARAVGLSVEPALLDAVVVDVLGRPGALPLLSTALVGTWERRRGDVLTLAGYLEAGGVAGALTRSAESTFARLDPPAQDRARRVLVRLADVDEGGALVRRRVPLSELALDDEHQAGTRSVVEAFVSRRLLAVDGDHLEVTHEALLTGWPRLARWLEDDAAGRAVRRNLAPAARAWADGGRPEDELYRGARLAGASDWASGDDADLTPVEQEFLDASRARTEAELTEARERARKEATGRRRTRRLAAGLAVVLVVALVAAGLAVRSEREAERATLVADANRLAALSTTAPSLDVSLLLAAQAVRLADTPETRDGLLTAVVDRGRALRAVSFSGRTLGASIGNDGQTFFLGAADQNFAWEIGSTSMPRAYYDYHDQWTLADSSPTEDMVMGAGVSEDGHPWLRLLSRDGTETTLLEREAVGGVPVAGSFSADGRRVLLVVAGPDDAAPTRSSRWRLVSVDPDRPRADDTGITGTLAVPFTRMFGTVSDDAGSVVLTGFEPGAPAVRVDLSDGRQVGLAVPARSVEGPVFRPFPSGAAQSWADGAVTLYDEDGAVLQTLDAHQAPVRDVAVSPDGRWAVTVGDGALVVLWDVDGSTGLWSQREILSGHRGDVITADVDPTGEQLFTTSLDDTVIVWDMTDGAGFGAVYPRTGDRWIANRPEEVEPGLLVAPTRAASSARVDPVSPPADTASVAATFLDGRTGELIEDVVLGDTVADDMFGSSVAVSPDGSMVAVTWGRGATVLHTRTREVVSEVEFPPEGTAPPNGILVPAWPVWCAAWTRDGTRLLLGAAAGTSDGDGGVIAVVDPLTGRVVDAAGYAIAAQVMEPTSDGTLIAVAGRDGEAIHLLNAETLDFERTVDLGFSDFVVTMDFSPDGRFLIAGGKFGLLHLIDTETWTPARGPTSVHEDSVLQVEWLDNRTVVSSGIDATVRLFDAERGLVRGRPLRASTDPDTGSTWFVPGPADEIVALSGDRPGRRYPLDPAVWIEEACSIVGRDLTQAEWDRYLPRRDRTPTCTDLP
jgi:DNA-binding SARP family transcriptional activator/WD40 repeat protein